MNSNKITRLIIDHLNEAILVVDNKLNIKYLNPSAKEILDLEAVKSVIDRDIFKFLVFIEDSAKTTIINAIDSGFDYFSNTAKVKTAKREKHISYTLTKFSEEDEIDCMIVINDVTEDKENQEEVFRLSQAVNHSADSITITNPEGTILYANPAFFQLTGYSYEDVIGNRHNIVNSGVHEKGFFEDLWRQITSGGIYKGTITNKRKDGEIYHELKTIVPLLDDKHNIINYIATGKDITQQIFAENELKELNKSLEDRVLKEVEKNRAKDKVLHEQSRRSSMGELLVNIAHQWRQPLNSIGLIVQNLEDAFEYEELTKEGMKESSEQILETLDKLSNIISQFTSFYEKSPTYKNFFIKNALDKAISLVGYSLDERGVKVDSNIEEKLKVYGNENEFAQIFINILTNAKDISKERNITNPKVFISVYREKDEKIIKIIDNLGGAKDEIIEKIFDPYFTTKFKGEGVGMGMYVVRETVEYKMKGSITASNGHKGLEITIKLPLPQE